jgi:hypothetical protein
MLDIASTRKFIDQCWATKSSRPWSSTSKARTNRRPSTRLGGVRVHGRGGGAVRELGAGEALRVSRCSHRGRQATRPHAGHPDRHPGSGTDTVLLYEHLDKQRRWPAGRRGTVLDPAPGEKFPQPQFIGTGVLGPHSNARGPNEFLHIPTGKRVSLVIAQVPADHIAQGRNTT